MKHLLAAVAVFACALALVVALPSTSFAGGGHGYKRHHGHGHHYRHRGHHRHGYRHHRRSNFHFGFSYYGHRPYYGRGYGYPRSYRPPRVVYVEPPIQWVEPSPRYVTPPAAQQPSSPAPAQFPEGCRLIREYQTQVTIGGELVDAYGDACLKADGSWQRGPTKIVPQSY